MDKINNILFEISIKYDINKFCGFYLKTSTKYRFILLRFIKVYNDLVKQPYDLILYFVITCMANRIG